jgi:hypothetical protein
MAAGLVHENSIADRSGNTPRSVHQPSSTCPRRSQAGCHGRAAYAKRPCAECNSAVDARFWRSREALPGMERWLRHLFAVRIGRAGLLEHRHFMSAEGYSVRKAATAGDPKIGCGVVISRCIKSTNDGCYLRPISLTKVGQDDKRKASLDERQRRRYDGSPTRIPARSAHSKDNP